MNSPPDAYEAWAARYDEVVDAEPRNRSIRRGFQELVGRSVRPGSLLLDFGAGTGLDAAWYAERGYRVLAYDVSREMLERLRQRCAGPITRGAVVPLLAPFANFPALMAGQPRPDAITANFGVLNAIPQPQDFFGAVAALLRPGAPLIVSVLNPFYWRGFTERWWWAALRRSRATGSIVTHGDGFLTHRHFRSSLRKAAAPLFHLRTVPPPRHLGQWLFLVFQRT